MMTIVFLAIVKIYPVFLHMVSGKELHSKHSFIKYSNVAFSAPLPNTIKDYSYQLQREGLP